MNTIPFQIYAWISCALFAGESLTAKLISKHKIDNPWLFNIVWIFFVVLLNSIICLWKGVGIPAFWGNIFWAGLFFALSMVLYILVVNKFDVSVFVPLENFRVIFSLLLGAFFLGEVLTRNQIGLIVVMIIAGMLVTLDEKLTTKSFFNKKMLILLAEMAALALWSMFLKKAAAETDYWTLNFWHVLIGGFLSLLTWPLFSKDLSKLGGGQVGSVILLALFGVLANLAATKAYISNIGISSAIISIPLSVIVVLVLAPFFPKLLESHSWKVYVIRILAAIVLVYAGIKLI